MCELLTKCTEVHGDQVDNYKSEICNNNNDNQDDLYGALIMQATTL